MNRPRARSAAGVVACVLAVSILISVGTHTAWAHPVAGPASISGDMPQAPIPPVVPRVFWPGQLRISAIGLDAPVVPVGTVMAGAPFLGGRLVPTFGVPPDGSMVGWWSDGPLVGGREMAILLGHTLVGGGYAAFNRLGELHPGDVVSVGDQAGGVSTEFRVARVVSGVPKSDPDALQRVLSENAPGSQLALITCGGEFDKDLRASAANVVVFAVAADFKG